MPYIVTAASGQLGRRIVDALLARGVAPRDIVATSRNVDSLSALADAGVTTAELDYSRPETVSAVVNEGDTLMLVSGSEVGQRVAQHTAVIHAARGAAVDRIVYTSVAEATTTSLILAPEHKATEEALVESGVPFTILRNNWYTENYYGDIVAGRETGEITASVGTGRVASATRAEYADAAAAALLDPSLAGQVFELSGDDAWDYEQLALAISELTGRPVSFRNLTPEEHVESLTAAGVDSGTAGFVVALDANIRDGALSRATGHLSSLTDKPTVSLVDGLARALEEQRPSWLAETSESRGNAATA
ncbi:NAD(P)H-binding protein [uncultured Microbacterium sp.]|uniref:NAD(P)H-binding protein n=1 Tax=uncultured Microbacterium sp. TaxID=191216 RepID=UPI0035CB145C